LLTGAAVSETTGAGDLCCGVATVEAVGVFWELGFLEPGFEPPFGAVNTWGFATFSLENGVLALGLVMLLDPLFFQKIGLCFVFTPGILTKHPLLFRQCTWVMSY
jgi:hypothetical protein